MTDQNKRLNLATELERATESLRAADHLLSGQFRNDAVSRLYYFVFHAIRALLFSKGLEPRSHEGMLRLFGSEFVKPGIFLPGDSHLIAQLMKFREEADYNADYIFTLNDIQKLRQDSVSLHEKILQHLRQQQFIP